MIKQKDQKINELEKDKKEKDRSKILTEDEVQNDFSNVYNNSNISSLTNSGTATPRLSFPVNSHDLITELRREADLRNENPNSGRISFVTPLTQLNSSESQYTLRTLASNQSSMPSLISSLSSQNSIPSLISSSSSQSSIPSLISYSTSSSQSSIP